MAASYPNTDMGFSNGAESQITGGSTGANERCRLIAQTFRFQWIRLNAWAPAYWFDNAKANGLRVSVVLDGGQCTTAGVDALYSNHAGKFDAIEVGNECSAGNRDPDYSGLTGSGNGPNAYAQLLHDIFARVRSKGDTTTPVLICGLTNDGTPNWGHNPSGWLQAMCQTIANNGALLVNGAWPFDMANAHPYFVYDPNFDPGRQTSYAYGGMAEVDALHNVLVGFAGAPQRVACTEFGYDYTVGPASGSPSLPAYVSSMITNWRSRAFTSFFLSFCFEMDAGTANPDNYGVIAPNDGSVAGINNAPHRPWYTTLQGFGDAPPAPPLNVRVVQVANDTTPAGATFGAHGTNSSAQLAITLAADPASGQPADQINDMEAELSGPGFICSLATVGSPLGFNVTWDTTTACNGVTPRDGTYTLTPAANSLAQRSGALAPAPTRGPSVTFQLLNQQPLPPTNVAVLKVGGVSPPNGATVGANGANKGTSVELDLTSTAASAAANDQIDHMSVGIVGLGGISYLHSIDTAPAFGNICYWDVSAGVPDGDYQITPVAVSKAQQAGLLTPSPTAGPAIVVHVLNTAPAGGAPTVTMISPPAGGPAPTWGVGTANGPKFALMLQAVPTAGSTVTAAGFHLDGSASVLSAQPTGGYPSPSSWPSPTSYPGGGANQWFVPIDVTSLAPGDHTVTGIATASNGLTSAPTPVAHFTVANNIDATPPSAISVLAPAAGACIGPSCSPPTPTTFALTAQATAAGGSGISAMTFTLTPATGTPVTVTGGTPSPVAPGSTTFTSSTSIDARGTLADGTWTITATATTGGGLSAASGGIAVSVHIGVDTTPPVNLVITSPSPGQVFTTAATIALVGQATDLESAVTAGSFSIDGGTPITATVTPAGANVFTLTATVAANAFPAGSSHHVRMSATSGGGTAQTPPPGVTFQVAGIAPPPPPPVTVSAHETLDDILSGRSRSVTAGVLFELVDQTGSTLGELHPAADSSMTGRITWKSTATIRRTCTGVALSPADAAGINVFTDLVQVWWTFGDVRIPVGRFEFGDVPTRLRTPTARWAYPNLNDTLARASQRIDHTVSYPTGTNIAAAIRNIFIELGYTQFAVDDLGAVSGAPLTFPLASGQTWIKVLETLASLAACYPPYADATGVPTVRQVPTITDESADFTYVPGQTCIITSGTTDPQEKVDTSGAANLFIVTESSGNQAPITAQYELPPSAPQSFANRGYYVPQVVTAQGLSGPDQALQQAIAAATNAQYHRTVSFDTIPNPLHDGFALVRMWDGLVYLETDWSLTLRPEGPHSHTAQRVVNVQPYITGFAPSQLVIPPGPVIGTTGTAKFDTPGSTFDDPGTTFT